MTKCQAVTKLGQQSTRVFRGVRVVPTMVEMSLHLTPTGMAMIRQHLDQALIVLLCRIEIRMHKRAAVGVTPGIHDLRIFASPPVQSAFLLGPGNPSSAALWIDCGLEVIRQR